MADVSVRPAAGPDVELIGLVQARAWTSGYAGLLGPELLGEATAENLADGWRAAVVAPPSPRHRVLVAAAGPAVVGFAATAPSLDPDAAAEDGELVTLIVDPAHVRAGHGSRLLAAATDVLRESGMSVVRIWIATTDTAMRGFLTAAGLTPDGASREVATPGGRHLTEVRLHAALTDEAASLSDAP